MCPPSTQVYTPYEQRLFGEFVQFECEHETSSACGGDDLDAFHSIIDDAAALVARLPDQFSLICDGIENNPTLVVDDLFKKIPEIHRLFPVDSMGTNYNLPFALNPIQVRATFTRELTAVIDKFKLNDIEFDTIRMTAAFVQEFIGEKNEIDIKENTPINVAFMYIVFELWNQHSREEWNGV